MKSLTIKIIPSILLFCFCLSGTIYAEKTTSIYRWVDKDGNVNYAERPGDESAVKINKLGRRFSSVKNKDDKADEIKKNRDKMCLDAKNTKKKYKSAPFLFREDKETKQQIRLTEQERKDAFLRVDKDISYWCNPQPEESVTKTQ